jgi:hypothetical protein
MAIRGSGLGVRGLSLAIGLSIVPLTRGHASAQTSDPVPAYFPVSFIAPDSNASMQIAGPGIVAAVPCTSSCTLALSQGTYFVRIDSAGRTWTVPVVVGGEQSVVVDVPEKGTRALGITFAIVGGGIVAVTTSFVIVTLVLCPVFGVALSGLGGGCNLEPLVEELPYLLTVTGAGLVIGGVGVGLIAATNRPSVDVVPRRRGPQVRARAPSTFVGLAPVRGAAGAQLLVRGTF